METTPQGALELRAPRALAARRAAVDPAWLRLVDRFHRSERSGAVSAADALLVALAAATSGLGVRPALTAVVVSVVAARAAGAYRPRDTIETQGVMWYPPHVAAAVAAGGLVASAVAGDLAAPVRGLTYAMLAMVVLTAARGAAWAVLARARRAGRGLRPAAVVGTGATVALVVDKMRRYPEAGLEPVGVVGGADAAGLPAWDLAGARERFESAGVAHVVLVPQGSNCPLTAAAIALLDGYDAPFSVLPALAEVQVSPAEVSQLGGVPLVPAGRLTARPGPFPGKRAFDVVGATLALLALSPLLIATALVIRIFDGPPVIYRQVRVGTGGRPFGMLKFRSMVVGAERLVVDLRDHNVTDGLLFKMDDDPRVTRVGRVIRRLSIDELPQLVNVLRGQMSLVGPRPLPVAPEEFGALEDRRHAVRPGITGYWQTAGGPGLTYREMINLDLAYIRNWSLWLDVRLLLRTLPALVHRRGPT